MSETADDPAILRAILDRSPDFISLSDFSGVVLYVNPAGLALVGLAALPEDGQLTTVDFFTGGGLAVASEVEAALSERGLWKGRSEFESFDTGEPIAVSISTFVVHRPDDRPAVIASIVHDRRRSDKRDTRLLAAATAAAQYAAEQQAVAELSRLALDAELPRLLTSSVTAAAVLMGVEGATITRAGDGLDAVMTVEAYTGTDVSAGTVPGGTMSSMGYALSTDDVVVCVDHETENRFDTTMLAEYGMRSTVAVPIAASDEPWGVLSVHSVDAREYGEREVSFLRAVAGVLSTALRRIELDRQLRRRSMHDALTGLPNRTLAYERIDEALLRALELTGSVAVLLLDIDDFKIINDSLGHDAGDRALVRFAYRLNSAVREQDFVARLGGDEFLVVCEGVDSVEHAAALADRITTKIAAPFSPDSTPLPLSASIGIAISQPSSTRRELVHQADLAMYRAKDSGTGGHAVFDTGDLYDADRIRSLSVDLRSALSRGDLTLAYQPLVEISTGRTVAVEALARWHHERHGEISPVEFVAVAERTGLATELGTWALTTACRQAAKWREFTDITIRVNVSALQLRSSSFPSLVASILADTGVPPHALGLEITETVWVADTARVADTLADLHSMGVAILLDDLGKGHSSIAYLDRYPVFDCFKIDGSYIAALPGERPRAIITAIVALARAFDVTVVGEGVETQEQLDALAASGCDLAQGYFLGRPAPADATTKVLRSNAGH